MTITPITPLNREKLVSTSTSIIINFTRSPSRVDVDGYTAYNSGIFSDGWTGSLINLLESGKRLVLNSAAPFILGNAVTVYVEETGGETLSYVFQVGVTQATTTEDAVSPSVVSTPGGQYLGYVKENGEMYVRFTEPLSAEVKLIQATIVDVGYDPTINKLVVFFVNNGNVYATVADPGDGPNSILPPGEAETPSKAVAFPFEFQQPNALGGSGKLQSFSNFNFPPIKSAPSIEPATVTALGGDGPGGSYTGFPRPVTPDIVSDNPRILRLPRSQNQPESNLAIGFYVYKGSTEYTGFRLISDFVQLPAGAQYVEFTDPVLTPNAVYAVVAVYNLGQSSGSVSSVLGDPGVPASNTSVFDNHNTTVLGSYGIAGTFRILGTFPPLKHAPPIDGPIKTTALAGAGQYQSFSR